MLSPITPFVLIVPTPLLDTIKIALVEMIIIDSLLEGENQSSNR